MYSSRAWLSSQCFETQLSHLKAQNTILHNFTMVSSRLVRTHPQYAVSLTHGPATQEVDLIVMVEDDDDVLFAELIHRGLISVQRALCARPPF